MNPIELIRQHLGDADWQVCRKAWAESAILRQVDDLSPFRAFKIYRVQGATHQFDFPMLPHCSFGLYAANSFKAIRLTRANKEIESVLAEVWSSLAECDPVILASLVLMFYDVGIQRTHRVLADESSLRDTQRFPQQYVLDEEEYASATPHVGKTELRKEGDDVALRAVTLCGWMHDKRNLGIERLHISHKGDVTLDQREVLSSHIFKSVPAIRY